MGSNDPQVQATADSTTAAELADEVKAYLHAARRKIHIAEYHLSCLRSALAVSERPGEPSVPVQAHLEGILYSVIAASDQAYEATKLGPARPFRCNLEAWRQEPIHKDVRAVRRLATHHHYRKTPAGPRLEVQEQGKPYGKSRVLDVYSEAACDHLRRLLPLLGEIESAVSVSAVEHHGRSE
jgi:hypothetical protein